ncbi:MAG: VanZ family protein [Thermoanaerobaculia bacterium]
MPPGSGERRFWIAAGLWLAAIYVSAYQARAVAEALRARGLLSAAVATAFAVAACLILVWAARSRPAAATFAILALAAGALALCLRRIPSPEEKIHFIEYGVLAGLLRAAMARLPPWVRAAAAIVLTALAGLGDETIQRYLPNRVFDWRDVAVNATAGALVVVTAELLDRVGRRGRAGT